MKEKRDKKKKHSKKHKKESREKRRRSPSATSSSNSQSDEWVEKEQKQPASSNREDWMSMTGMLKTYTKEDIRPKQDQKEKKHIDSYNPATSSRELNPYWKEGGSGLPQTAASFQQSRPFIKPPDDDEDYYRSSSSKNDQSSQSNEYNRKYNKDYHYHDKNTNTYNSNDSYSHNKSYIWKKETKSREEEKEPHEKNDKLHDALVQTPLAKQEKPKDNNYLSDEKMNKLAAKIVKAEIMGDIKQVEGLKVKLEAAREYRKQNPDAGKEEEDECVMLMSMNSAGNSRPLSKRDRGDPRSKGGKRKSTTHDAGQRTKYFGNDDKYNLAQMFQEEKYGNNYDDEAQLARIASKHKNPNDDLEDIFVDEISKNRNEAKESENEKQRAINQHVKLEKSLEGCEYCVDSKNMLKHLMVSCGNKVYLALPAKQSLVPGHCIITTIQHANCVTAVDEDVWEEVMNYRKALTHLFNSQNKDVVFFETATRLHRFPHMVINCIPLPRDVGDMAAIYFKKALLECEAEWSMNKKVIDLKGKNIRKGVPKGLPYFWIDFGMDPGFAHVIEDQQLFPKLFAEEIIGGFLDLDHHLWKNPKKEYGDLQRKKVVEFLKEWKPFEEMVKNK